MMEQRAPRSPREKYGEELKLRRLALGMTQDAVAQEMMCSPTLISHYEAGRRLPSPADAKRLDKVLGTDGFFERWLEDLDSKFAQFFSAVAELEKQAVEIRQWGLALVPGLLQTGDYARAVFRAYSPNYRTEELDRLVVNRTERAEMLEGASGPVLWTLLDEAVIRRRVGGPLAMAVQLRKIVDMAETGRLRLHVMPFGAGEHSLMESPLDLMSFEDAAPVAYVEGLQTGHLMDDPALVSHCQAAYDLALSDALSLKESLALVRAVAEEHEHGQQ
ncbi:helix-turn-helix transcriptional regulator [Streptomyces sp. NBC_01498]|uniref:helix-turn-helix domain-containing protein n=1 Tax=Streptomyces sp. NBC_01498 TaxID=2975870 RepID=UPI002E7ACB64|nr:helix-turn-helix transcriptional regulator [Streptomyces sp. NBC_01498]WTL28778.1 helix-turn-helix transcriptional regulator [Streptomyces sp. NBC_01498]